MAKSSNPFNLLADYENDDLSLLIADHLKAKTKKSPSKSPKAPRKPLAPSQTTANGSNPLLKPAKRANLDRGSDNLENDSVLERGFFRKFSVSEDGELEKPEIGGGLRSKSIGGPRRSYRNRSRLLCRPGREYIDQESEDYVVMMSSKYRLFDRHSLCGRSNGSKREGFGRWNWGTMMEDEEQEQWSASLANSFEDDVNGNQSDEGASEDEEMTLDEYEKVKVEKKRALQAILLEIAAKQKEEEDFINEFVIIDVADADGFQF